jgi:hypothetical protein
VLYDFNVTISIHDDPFIQERDGNSPTVSEAASSHDRRRMFNTLNGITNVKGIVVNWATNE